MKRAVILHGTDGKPTDNWFQWLKLQLEPKGFEVWVPELPNNHTPNRKTYNDFLFKSGWDFKDNLVIGHSSGAVSVLNLLEDDRCPHIKAGVLVGAWSHMEETDLDREQFKDLFPDDGFNFETIKQKAGELIYLHGDDDPFCPLKQAKWLSSQTHSELIIIPKGQHLGSTHVELPQLLNALEKHRLV
jgi:predicted alpha/beta hydrolase family esterase